MSRESGAETTEIRRVLSAHLHDPSSSFSIGSFGAIAEFHRDSDEPLELDRPEALTVATERGALRIDLEPGLKPVAYEAPSGRPGRWQHGVLFCLPEPEAASQGRTAITELGPDEAAIREEDRESILIDMGLGARNIDFCIRTQDLELLALARRYSGRSILEPGNALMEAIIDKGPHRIALSALGRAEVYQGIDRVKTPAGPHTHVLPKFLKSGRTHSANLPVPEGWLPCLSLYPANPLYDGLGRERAFDRQSLDAFDDLLELWGTEAYRSEKTRLRRALAAEQAPEGYVPPDSRLGRAALRVVLRQLRCTEPENPQIAAWSQHFDRPSTQLDEADEDFEALSREHPT